MDTIETRLSARHANIDGIKRFIHRHLGRNPVSRVELRYSVQSPEVLDPQKAKQAICNLLRENGMGNAAVSVRAHEGPIDDATGEHVVRLYPIQPKVTSPGTRTAGPAPVGWWARRFPKWFKGRPAAESLDAVVPVPNIVRLSNAQAVAHLREAVLAATSFIEDENGDIVSAKQLSQPVARAHVIVRLQALHEVLQPLIIADAAQTAHSIGAMAQALGLKTRGDFEVSYTYKQRAPGDGSVYATESDVEVVLRAGGKGAARVEPTLDADSKPQTRKPRATSVPQPVIYGTAMPALPGTRAADQNNPVLTLRVTGTTTQKFASAFEFKFAALPVRVDRELLMKSEFGRQHPELLQVASNSCPLTVRQAGDGRVLLEAATRTMVGGDAIAMYYEAASQEGLSGEMQITPGVHKLLINAPNGVHAVQTGTHLPAICIELVLHRTRESATCLPMAAGSVAISHA